MFDFSLWSVSEWPTATTLSLRLSVSPLSYFHTALLNAFRSKWKKKEKVVKQGMFFSTILSQLSWVFELEEKRWASLIMWTWSHSQERERERVNEKVKDSVSVSLELSLVTMLVNLLSCLLLSLSSSHSLSLVKSLLLLRVFPEGVCNFKPVPCHKLAVETC